MESIVEKGLETTNNLVVSKRLFPLLIGGSPPPSPLYCGWTCDSAATDFGGLTSRFQTHKIGSLMRLQTLGEAGWILALLALLAIVFGLFSAWAFWFFVLLCLCTVAFFRDPERAAPVDPNVIVAAADGTVMDIVELDEKEVLKNKMRRVGIFLSIFDVHTNRAPIDGRVVYRQHRSGLCLDARRPDCSEKNESMTWAFENPRVTIVVRQITGAIARRIVAWANVGDELKKGERFGMIRFGSRTELYLPLNAEVLVKVGDHVVGGSTIIARLAEAVRETEKPASAESASPFREGEGIKVRGFTTYSHQRNPYTVLSLEKGEAAANTT
jgi:phosphatidylserine decarboxylase